MINWLPLSDRKNISTCRIMYYDYNGQNYGGYYHNNTLHIVLWNEERIPSTIAHEFRHHVQRELGLYKNIKDIVPRSDIEYNSMIKWYFNTSIKELDALLYEHKYAKSDLNDWWLKHLTAPKGYACGRSIVR